MSDTEAKHKKASLSILIDLYFVEDGEFVTAYSPLLDLSSFGKTEEEAALMFLEALKITAEYQEDNIDRLITGLK